MRSDYESIRCIFLQRMQHPLSSQYSFKPRCKWFAIHSQHTIFNYSLCGPIMNQWCIFSPTNATSIITQYSFKTRCKWFAIHSQHTIFVYSLCGPIMNQSDAFFSNVCNTYLIITQYPFQMKFQVSVIHIPLCIFSICFHHSISCIFLQLMQYKYYSISFPNEIIGVCYSYDHIPLSIFQFAFISVSVV